MSDSNLLISLIQQQIADTSQTSGRFYKILSPTEKEFTVSINGFEDYIVNLLALLNRSNRKYFDDKFNAMRDKTEFIPTNYGFTLCEKISNYISPIRINVNLKFGNLEKNLFFQDDFIYKCISILQEIIVGVFSIEHDDNSGLCKELICFALKTDPWIEDDHVFINLCFLFPYARVNLEYINRAVVHHFRKNIVSEDIFKDFLNQTPIGDIKTIIPELSEYVPVYGCKSKQNEAPLLLKGVYSYIEDLPSNEEAMNETTLPFYVDYYTSEFTNPLRSALIINRYIDINCLVDDRFELLPLMTSIFYYDGILKINPNVDLSPTDISTKQMEPKYESKVNCTYDKFTKLAELIPMISRSRTTTTYRYFWETIGKAIHNIYSGTTFGLETFINITSDIELKDECKELYDKMHNEILDIRTIEQFAAEDSPDQYKMWKKSQYVHKIPSLLTLANLNVAEVIAEFFSLEYVFDRLNKEWYHFTSNRCKRDVGGLEFIKSIRDNFTPILYEYSDELNSKSMAEQTRAGKKYYEDQIKEVRKAILKFSDLNFLNSVLKACEIFMFDDNLYVKTDEDKALTGCMNGVIECYGDNITLRPGKLQDYITKNTNIRFPTCFDWNDTKVQFVRKYYGQVHTDQHLCHYFMKWMASILLGGNHEKFFMNWIGEANASKSQVLKFLQLALGDYCVMFPNHLITVNINSNSGRPEPALEKAKGAKLAVVAETDISERLHVGQIKKFTGNDTYTNRTLNKEGGERSLTFKLVHMSNIICSVEGADEAYNIREVIIPFLSKWVDNAPYDISEQYAQRRFQIDLDFSDRIKYYAQAQLWLMFMYYPIYRKEKIRILPDIVKRVTLKHHLDIDVFHNFIKDRVQYHYIGDPKDKILNKNVTTTLFELFNIYKRWFKMCYGHKNEPLDYIKFGNELVKRIGDDDNGVFYGLAPRQEVAASGGI